MKAFRNLLIAGVVIFAALQFVRPGIPAQPITAEVKASPQIRQILETHCYSCHSDERRLSWFDQIVPGYWLVRHDVLTAREHLNFSRLGAKPAAAQEAALYEAVNMIQLGAMPLASFVRLHPNAKVSAEEVAALKSYLAPWTPAPNPVANTRGAAGKTDASPAAVSNQSAAPVQLDAVPPEWNGLAFDPSFKNWKAISTTDRGDNNTFRFILGNDIAIKAAQTGNIAPWPDGARFAKIAWQQQPGADGLVHPGKFVQVELMVKNASRYRDTEGWGWGRWRGLDLKPYGTNARFVGECTTCHLPMRGDDYVYTLPISSARAAAREIVNHNAATLPAGLPRNPLGWGVITMYVDRGAQTTAALYGNDAAVQASRDKSPQYGPGAALALVTWAQREDPHWFGARIPNTPQSVEFVEMGAGGARNYQRFAGQASGEDRNAKQAAAARTNFILGLAPVQLP